MLALGERAEGNFVLVADESGIYRFCIDSAQNSALISNMRVSFLVKVFSGNHKIDDFDHTIGTQARLCSAALEDIVFEQLILIQRFSSHIFSLSETESLITNWTFAESAVLLCIVIGQILYVRRLIDKRFW